MKVTLITMPVVAVNCPSISLTQVQAATQRALGDRVDVEILYLNHDFARWMSGEGAGESGVDLYRIFCGNQLHNTGVADWFFRQAAFPELEDNADQYLSRYYPGHAKDTQRFRAALLEKRAGLDAFIDEVIDRHRIDGADLVGFTSMFQQNVATFALARKLKQRRADLTVVMGGANCEPPMGQQIARNVPSIDYVFTGPALKSFPQFVGCRLDGVPRRCTEINGVLTRDRAGAESCAAIGDELDIDDVLDLDYSAFLSSLDRHYPGGELEPVIFFETSRGCWWGERSHCTFCGLNGTTMQYRSMQPQRAIEQFERLFERYAPKSSFFFAVDNILPKSYLKEVLPHLEPPAGATIFYEVKADLTADDLRTLAAAGVNKIQPGIESLASSTLALMRKGTSVFMNLRLLKNCLRYGVRPQWNLLIGFPGEGEDVYRKYVADIPRLAHLFPPDGAFPVRFDRYSPYHERAREYGLELECYDYYHYIYPFDDRSLDGLAYYFMDQNFDAPYFKTMVQWLGPVRHVVEQWRRRWDAANGAMRPELVLRRDGEGAVVRDSRTGELVEHRVDALQLRLLELLEKQRQRRHLDEIAAKEGLELDRGLAWLDERELVWREDETWMSLVLVD